jgi:hypothetical protein
MKKIIGDLSNLERVLVGLDLTQLPAMPASKTSKTAKPTGR